MLFIMLFGGTGANPSIFGPGVPVHPRNFFVLWLVFGYNSGRQNYHER